MQPALVVRFRPAGPWRIGPDTGSRETVDLIYHSDSLFSALSQAMAALGLLEDWLEATVRAPEQPALAVSSCFPYLDEIHFVTPPLTLWPPPASPKLRWESAHFVPLSLVNDLLAEQPLAEDAWWLDGPSRCLMPAAVRFSAPGPFRLNVRIRAAVDRLTSQVVPHKTACLEFPDSGGLWCLVGFASEEAYGRWAQPVQNALRWLADTGFGGERTQGWGQCEAPEFIEAELPGTILTAAGSEPNGGPGAYWLLSLYVPSLGDQIDWQRSRYSLIVRGGRVESPRGWGTPKKLLRMVREGSVLCTAGSLRGAARDVAPDGFPHPVYRSGLALALRIGPGPERVANSEHIAGTA